MHLFHNSESMVLQGHGIRVLFDYSTVEEQKRQSDEQIAQMQAQLSEILACFNGRVKTRMMSETKSELSPCDTIRLIVSSMRPS